MNNRKWTIKNLIFNNILSDDGDLHRKVSICLESNIYGNTEYEWDIIRHSAEQEQVYGLVVSSNFGDLLDYTLEPFNEGGKMGDRLKIKLKPHNIHDRTTLEISYFIPRYATLESPKALAFFYKRYHFRWNYKFLRSVTEKLEYRIRLPDNAKEKERNEATTSVKNYKYTFDKSEYVVFFTREEITDKDEIEGAISYIQKFEPLSITLDFFFALIVTLATLSGLDKSIQSYLVIIVSFLYLLLKFRIKS